MLQFGKYVLFIRLGDLARYRSHNLLIAPLLGLEAVARFAVASRLADAFESLTLRMIAVAGPAFANFAGRGDIDTIRRAYLLISQACAALVGIAAAGLIVFGGRFITLWLGPGFEESYTTLVPLILGMMVLGSQAPSRDVLGALYKHPFDAKTNAIEAVAAIALTLALVPSLGLAGAGYATAATMIVNKGVVLPRYVCRQLDLAPLLYYKTVARPLGVAWAGGLVAHLTLPLDRVESLLLLAGLGAGFAVCMAPLTYAVMTAECRALLRSALRRPDRRFSASQ